MGKKFSTGSNQGKKHVAEQARNGECGSGSQQEALRSDESGPQASHNVESHHSSSGSSGKENASAQEDQGTSTRQEAETWFDRGYVKPVARNTECNGLAILDPENYSGLRDLDTDAAKLYLEHELPEGYKIIKRIGKGAFGCCFLVEKKLSYLHPMTNFMERLEKTMGGIKGTTPSVKSEDAGCLHVVLKVVVGHITPRRPVIFYKTCSMYTLMITYKAFPLQLNNLKYIVGMLKYLHTEHNEVHGDLHPGNMMYFPKDITRDFYRPFTAYDRWDRWRHQSHIVQVLLDFIDHWFSMQDEQNSCIIDADIGGKIGDPKVIVNHRHHDPRNSSWQVSDDLIGLMNWVVLKSGNALESHSERGIVYYVKLESLKLLYNHIKGLYQELDSKFIFSSVFARQESFCLQLKRGKCYLDQLLEGGFLKFQFFKGSYSLGSSADSASSCVKLNVLEVVQAVATLKKAAYGRFEEVTQDPQYLSTLWEVLTLLADSSLHGGARFVIVDKKHKEELQLQALDDGLLTELCRKEASSVHKPSFKHILGYFCASTDTDCWEQSLLQDLAKAVEYETLEDAPHVEALKNQPKDGAFVLSHRGTILAAAMQLKHLPQEYQLRKVDGTRVGTGHTAALATVEWMRRDNVCGVVFVRSAAGQVHVMMPAHEQKLPLVMSIDSNTE